MAALVLYDVQDRELFLMNASLERARTALLARRAERGTLPLGRAGTQLKRHAELELAYSRSGSTHCLLIRYCPQCRLAIPTDLVREVPSNIPSAQALELKRARRWRIECSA
jgi:hypothetical protein